MTGNPEPSLQAATVGTKRSTWLTVLGIGVAVCMMTLGSVALIASRNDTWKQAQQGAGNLLLALDRDVTRNIAILDLSLQGLIEALQEPGIGQVSAGIRQHALFDQAASAEDLGSMLVLDEAGNVVEDSTSKVPHKLNLADRDYFKVHQHDPDVGMYISRVFSSRLAANDFRFAISRRLPEVNDQFVGVATGTLRLNYFTNLFEKLRLGKQGTITLLRTDGHIVVRYPFDPAEVDRDVSNGATFKRFMSAQAGQYVAKAAIDGVERLYTFRRLRDLPLILTVNLSVDEILAPWRRKAMVLGPVLLLLCASAIASSLLFRREVTRRAATEAALADAAQKLSVIASTDGLTGLANRRTFDLEYDRAFRRAVRSGTSLTVLMFDADWFKKYNDTYGHPAGDTVLRSIGTCLRQHLRRPDDLAARYGGEEFIALLPDTDSDAARAMAERIRLGIEGLAIEHSGSPFGIVTVSIGVAVASPCHGFDTAELIQAADRALYDAKRDGRNRSCTVDVSHGANGAATLLDLVTTVSHGGVTAASSSR
ncbi:MAG: diguanylate cyclase [Janthinobacterium lividum]